MHNVQIELDEDSYIRYKELAKKDRRSVRGYIAKLVIDNLINRTEAKSSQSVPSKYEIYNYLSPQSCGVCKKLISSGMEVVDTGEESCVHRECYEKENG